jgi:hypothetical protein
MLRLCAFFVRRFTGIVTENRLANLVKTYNGILQMPINQAIYCVELKEGTLPFRIKIEIKLPQHIRTAFSVEAMLGK